MTSLASRMALCMLALFVFTPVAQAETWEEWAKDINKRIEAADKNIAFLGQQNAAVVADLKKAKDSLADAIDEIDDLQEDNMKLKEELNKANERIGELNREIENLEKNVEQELDNDRKAREDVIDELEDVVKFVKEAEKKAEENKSYTDKALDKLGDVSELKDAVSKIKEIKQSVEEVQKNYAKIDKAYKDANKWAKDVSDKYDELEKHFKGDPQDKMAEDIKAQQTRIKSLEDVILNFKKEQFKPLLKRTAEIENTQKTHTDDLKTIKEWQGKQKEAVAKQVGDQLLKNETFMKSFGNRLITVGFGNKLAVNLTKNRTFLIGLVSNSDFQKSLAINMSKNNIRTFAGALLKSDDFTKGFEYRLSKSDRFAKTLSELLAKSGVLGPALAKDSKSMKAIATELAKDDYLKIIAEQLAKSGRFAAFIADSGAFLEKLTKSDKFINNLVGNSNFISKLKPKLQ